MKIYFSFFLRQHSFIFTFYLGCHFVHVEKLLPLEKVKFSLRQGKLNIVPFVYSIPCLRLQAIIGKAVVVFLTRYRRKHTQENPHAHNGLFR